MLLPPLSGYHRKLVYSLIESNYTSLYTTNRKEDNLNNKGTGQRICISKNKIHNNNNNIHSSPNRYKNKSEEDLSKEDYEYLNKMIGFRRIVQLISTLRKPV